MALSMLRQGLSAGRVFVCSARCVPAATSVSSKRTLVTKQFKKDNPNKPKPWPYETVKFTIFDAMFEDTQDRFDENSRIIVVEGNVGVGKSYLAKKIAEEFDLLLFPEANLDFAFINDEGFDERSISHLYPEPLQPYDIEKFYRVPKHMMTPHFQYSMLALRYEQYIDALAHLLSTGQGVVLERSPYTDFVFAEAMFKAGYLNNYDMEIYNQMKKNCRIDIFRPHVVVYLDAPIDVLQQRIKARGIPYEQNNSVLTPEYLREMDRCYKEEYLPSIEESVEVVCYDWTEFGDPLHVVEDLERLPLDKMMKDPYDPKFADWKGHTVRWWDHYRMRYTNEKFNLMMEAIHSVPNLNAPHLNASPEDIDEYNAVFEKYYQGKYAKGFNDINDGYLLRWGKDYRAYQRLAFFRTR